MQYHHREIKHTVTTHVQAFLEAEFCENCEYLGRQQIEEISVLTKHIENTGIVFSLLIINLTRAGSGGKISLSICMRHSYLLSPNSCEHGYSSYSLTSRKYASSIGGTL